MASYPLVDIYCHIYPETFFEEMTKLSPQTQNLGKRLRIITKLFDLSERFREMDRFGQYLAAKALRKRDESGFR